MRIHIAHLSHIKIGLVTLIAPAESESDISYEFRMNQSQFYIFC